MQMRKMVYLRGKEVENTEVRGKKSRDNCFDERPGEEGSKMGPKHRMCIKQHMHHILDCSYIVWQVCKDDDGDAEGGGYSCLRILYVPGASLFFPVLPHLFLDIAMFIISFHCLGTRSTERLNNLPKATQIISGRVQFSSRQCDC